MKDQEIDDVMEAFGERVTDDLIDTIKDMQNPLAGLAVAIDMRGHPDFEVCRIKRELSK